VAAARVEGGEGDRQGERRGRGRGSAQEEERGEGEISLEAIFS